MLNQFLAAAVLMAQTTTIAPAPAPIAPPVAAPAPAPDAAPPSLRINVADLAGCTALVNTLSANSSGDDQRSQLIRLLALNWSLVFDAAQGQTQQKIRTDYDAAMTRYKTQLTNAADDEVLAGVVLDRLNEHLMRCEGIRSQNAEFFAFQLGQYVEEQKAKQAAAAQTPASPAPAAP